MLVRLDFELILEPLLLYSPAAPPPTAAAVPLFYLRLVLETPNLVHSLGGSIQVFLKKNILVRLELVPLLNGLT